MKVNEVLRNQIFEVIENQIKANDPAETKLTLKRLKNLGYSDFESKQLIGQCLTIEIFNTLKLNKPFNEVRYIKNLNNLPEEPVEE